MQMTGRDPSALAVVGFDLHHGGIGATDVDEVLYLFSQRGNISGIFDKEAHDGVDKPMNDDIRHGPLLDFLRTDRGQQNGCAIGDELRFQSAKNLGFEEVQSGGVAGQAGENHPHDDAVTTSQLLGKSIRAVPEGFGRRHHFLSGCRTVLGLATENSRYRHDRDLGMRGDIPNAWATLHDSRPDRVAFSRNGVDVNISIVRISFEK